MKPSRRFRCFAAILALISLLYMQLAVAAYACPGLDRLQVAAAETAMADMPGCSGMDTEQPNLCYASGQSGKQSLDKPPVPGIPPFIPAGYATPLYLSEAVDGSLPCFGGEQPYSHAADPPLSILHCCFRL